MIGPQELKILNNVQSAKDMIGREIKNQTWRLRMEFEVIKPKHTLINKSAVKQFVNENKMRFSSKSFKRINESVEDLIKKAIKRSKLSGRKTILQQDC